MPNPNLPDRAFAGCAYPASHNFLILACTDADLQVKTVQPFVSPYKLILLLASSILLYLPERDNKINASIITTC